MKINRLRIEIETEEGLFGADLSIPNGLYVLRADNTSGKSTCIRAILYALGLEGMLSASHAIPLPHAITNELDYDNRKLHVRRSAVLLEVQNHAGEIWTTRRAVVGDEDRKLIRVWHSAIKGVRAADAHDYYVRIEGAASRLDGFHRKLAEFWGWDLPMVPRYDGQDGLLYVECMFPFIVVEQKKGWSDVPGHLPTQFRIRDVGARAVEFLLALESGGRSSDRQRLISELDGHKSSAVALFENVLGAVGAAGGLVDPIPDRANLAWILERQPRLLLMLNGKWVNASDAITAYKNQFDLIDRNGIPTVNEDASTLQEELRAAEEALRSIELEIANGIDEMSLERAEHRNIARRLDVLGEDLAHNRDALRLQEFGSHVLPTIASGRCPTCRQQIVDTLLPQDLHSHPMSIQDNIDFILEQTKIFSAMLAESERAIDAKEARLDSIRADADGYRRQVRTIKRTLLV